MSEKIELLPRIYKVTGLSQRGITIEWRDDDSWAICDGSNVLNRHGQWEYEPMPSSRTEEFKQRTRYPAAVVAFAIVKTTLGEPK